METVRKYQVLRFEISFYYFHCKLFVFNFNKKLENETGMLEKSGQRQKEVRESYFRTLYQMGGPS